MSDSKTFAILFVAILSITHAAFAEPQDQKQQTALNNLQAEVLKCSAFHLISQMGFEQSKNPGWEVTAAQASQNSAILNGYAVQLRDLIGQSKDGLQARLETTFEGVSNEMGKNFSNYSVLLRKYAQHCSALQEGLASVR